jgi:hypothetical protein
LVARKKFLPNHAGPYAVGYTDLPGTMQKRHLESKALELIVEAPGGQMRVSKDGASRSCFRSQTLQGGIFVVTINSMKCKKDIPARARFTAPEIEVPLSEATSDGSTVPGLASSLEDADGVIAELRLLLRGMVIVSRVCGGSLGTGSSSSSSLDICSMSEEASFVF